MLSRCLRAPQEESDLSSPIIRAEQLQRTYRVPQKRTGLGGALNDLIRPQYRVVHAVQNLSFEIQPGESVAYLGPNGAGKSTTVRMLAGILRPSGGELSVLGYQPHAQRQAYVRHIGVVFGQRTTLWMDLAVIESLRLLQRVYALPEGDFQERLAVFDEVLDLGRLLATPARKLSLGQRVRADLAAALLHAPQIVFLDEPTIGLDVSVKARIRAFLRRIHQELGTTLLLTTHDLGDVEAISDRVLVIDAGQLIFDGTSRSLREAHGQGHRIMVMAPQGNLAILNAATADLGLLWAEEATGRYSAAYNDRQIPTPELVSRALAAVPAQDLTLREASIEDVVRRLYEQDRHG